MKYVEIVNWKRAQPKMSGSGNSWMKLYTSLLDHEAFRGLDDTSRMLIIALWLYAARCGRYRFPADPQWLLRWIPMLNSPPDLEPLLTATDAWGTPQPFLKYCEPPAPKAPPDGPKGAARGRQGAARGRQGAARGRQGAARGRQGAARGRQGAAPRRCACGAELPPRRRKCDKCKGLTARARQKRAALSRADRRDQTREEEKPTETEESREDQTRKTKREKTTFSSSSAQGERDREQQKPGKPKEARREAAPRRPRDCPGRLRREHSARTGDAVPLGRCRTVKMHWQDPQARAFASAICRALGITDDGGQVYRRNWGAFGAAFVEAKCAYGVEAASAIREIGVAKAEYIGRTRARQSVKERAKQWFGPFRGSCAKHLTGRSPPAAVEA